MLQADGLQVWFEFWAADPSTGLSRRETLLVLHPLVQPHEQRLPYDTLFLGALARALVDGRACLRWSRRDGEPHARTLHACFASLLNVSSTEAALLLTSVDSCCRSSHCELWGPCRRLRSYTLSGVGSMGAEIMSEMAEQEENTRIGDGFR